ncbi:hypothetical protein ACO0QE_001146 [Hanseniaspora vineae]
MLRQVAISRSGTIIRKQVLRDCTRSNQSHLSQLINHPYSTQLTKYAYSTQTPSSESKNHLKIDSSVLEYTQRNTQIAETPDSYYPSLSDVVQKLAANEQFNNAKLITPATFNTIYTALNDNKQDVTHYIMGRIKHIRYAGKKMCFINIEQDNSSSQMIVNYKNVNNTILQISPIEFENFMKNQLRPGDHILCVGYPGVSLRERTPSLKLTQLPTLLSCRQLPLPPKLQDPTKIKNNRVVDYLVNGNTSKQIIYARHKLNQCVRRYLDNIGFIEVETPILSKNSNGANARPFVTILNHGLNNHKNTGENLELRIAPELWLKKLIIGGFDKIYEIGKVFRNEGVDATHNPEFSTLELYQTYITMEDLITISEELFQSILTQFKDKIDQELYTEMVAHNWKFQRVEFLPTLAKELGVTMTELEDCFVTTNDNQNTEVANTNFNKLYNYIPEKYAKMHFSPQQLLNKLCGDYIEDKYCMGKRPTLIYHHPTLMSPLSKSASHISKRFEVFIQGKEYMNAYEEENMPQIQHDKFIHQQQQRQKFNDDECLSVDQEYIRTMKYGMAPTGGLGMGIDRMLMLVCNKQRIEEVLSFGTVDDVMRQ